MVLQALANPGLPEPHDETLAEAQAATRTAVAWLDGSLRSHRPPDVTYAGPPFTLRVTGHPPATAGAVARAFKPAFEILRSTSRGKILVEDHWAESAHKGREGVAALLDGRSDFAPIYSAWDPAAYPLAQALALPGLFSSAELGTAVSEELYAKYMRADVESQGILMGRLKATGEYHLFSNAPIRTLEDLRGARVGTTEGIEVEVLRSLGAVPVTMRSLDIVPALSSGAIDAVSLSDCPAQDYGVSKLVRFRTGLNFCRLNLEYGLSRRFYDALPADLQRVLSVWLRAEAQAEAQVFYRLAGAEARQGFLNNGMTFVQLAPGEHARWLARFAHLTDAFIAENEAAGRPARQLLADITALNAAYAGLTPNDFMQQAIDRPLETVQTIRAD